MNPELEKKKVFIIGAGTLGKLIIDIVESGELFQVGGFYDDHFPALQSVLGYPVLGKIAEISKSESSALAIGVGDPASRKIILEREEKFGHTFPTLVHASVVVSNHCQIEEATIIGPNSSVLSGTHIKRGTCILSHVNINQDVIIGSFCLIGAGVVVGNKAILGDGCHIALGKVVNLESNIAGWTYYS